MKKVYETPEVEKIAFQYRDQVVAASNGISGTCTFTWENLEAESHSTCVTGWKGNMAS